MGTQKFYLCNMSSSKYIQIFSNFVNLMTLLYNRQKVDEVAMIPWDCRRLMRQDTACWDPQSSSAHPWMTLIMHRPDRDRIFESRTYTVCLCLCGWNTVHPQACMVYGWINQQSSQGVHGVPAGNALIIVWSQSFWGRA